MRLFNGILVGTICASMLTGVNAVAQDAKVADSERVDHLLAQMIMDE